MAVRQRTVQIGRGIDDPDVALVGKLQDALNVFVGELSDFIHHAVEGKRPGTPLNLFLEYIDEKDVDDCLDKDIRSFRTNGPHIVGPWGGIAVLNNLKLQ